MMNMNDRRREDLLWFLILAPIVLPLIFYLIGWVIERTTWLHGA